MENSTLDLFPAETGRTHLFRGAPCVRSWSKYQETVQEWTLCGIRRKAVAGEKTGVGATEDPGKVLCPHCLELMKPTKRELARARKKAVA